MTCIFLILCHVLMLSQNDHKLRADHNLRILEVLSSSQSLTGDWQVVLMFYAAIHAVTMHLCCFPDIKCESHKERNDLITPSIDGLDYTLPPDVYLAYNKLEGASKVARYMQGKNPGELRSSTQQFFSNKKVYDFLKNLDKVLFHYESRLSISFEKITIKVRKDVNLEDFKVLTVVKFDDVVA